MKTEKMKKLVTNLLEKTDYVMHIKNLKQALNHELILKKDYLVIKFNKNNWLKLYIYWYKYSAKTKTKKKKKLRRICLGWWIMQFFWKSMENMRKHRDYQVVTAETRRNNLVSQPNYRITKYFAENLLTVELRKNSSIKK